MNDERVTPSSKIDTKAFFDSGAIDALLQMVLVLGSELSAMSEKVDTIVDLLAAQGLTRTTEVETFLPDAEQQRRRDSARQRLVQALLAPYQLEADALAGRATEAAAAAKRSAPAAPG